MTQNLRLGSTSANITLTSADSDVTSNFTIPASAVQTSGTTSWAGTVDAIHVYDNGNHWIQPTSSGNDATVNTTGTPPSQSQYIGNYYNWYTATASTGTAAMTSGNATSSICPKGWKLPTGNTANGSFSALTTALGAGENAAGSWILQNAPNYFILSGRYDGGVVSQGSGSRWWARTAYSTNVLAYNMLVSSSVNPRNVNTKSNGNLVRCIAN